MRRRSGRAALRLQSHGSESEPVADAPVREITDSVARRIYERKLELGIASDSLTDDRPAVRWEDDDDE